MIMKRILIYSIMLVLLLSSYATTSYAQANGANPYDEVGATHNLLLAQFFNAYTKERIAEEGLDEKGLYTYSCGKLAMQDCDALEALRNADIVQATKGMTPSKAAAYLQAKGLVGATYVAYVGKLERAVGQYAAADYPSLYRAVLVVESSIMADATLKEAERSQLLAGSSVTRYSAKFWKDASSGETHYAGLGSGLLATATPDTLNDIILQDVWGAYLGGMAGFMASGGRFIKYAIVMAAVGSIGRAAYLFWGW
jgi:hypothetical protein